jgi:chemotaxis protein MotA
MDVSTIIGVSVGVLIMVTSIVLGGAPFSIFVDSSAILCVVGGSLCAVMICYPLRAIMLLPFAIVRTVFVQTPNTQQITEQIVRLAGIARRDGLLALENRLEELPSPLLRLGLQLAIDAIAHRHLLCKGVLDQLGRFAPAFGMIGTMLGLVMMLNKMTDPSSIGSGMAVALLTTLYGAVLANLFCLPLSEKLSYYHREEIQSLELISKGVMAVQSGDNPRVIEQKLRTVHVPQPPALRKAA